MNEFTTHRNTDRYMKCCSCNTTATRLLSAVGISHTQLRNCRVYGGTEEWTEQHPVMISTCERHLALNTKRIQQAEATVTDRRIAYPAQEA